MHYAEAIVNNILCCKNTPEGEWIPLSQEQLTKKIIRLQVENSMLKNKLEVAQRKLHDPI